MALPNGDVLVTWFSTTSETGREVAFAGARLAAGTRDWTQAFLVYKPPDRCQQTPAFFFDNATATLHLYTAYSAAATYGNAVVARKLSKDYGHTWSTGEIVMPEHDGRLGHLPFERVTVLPDGRWAMPQTKLPSSSNLQLSGDGGRTWTPTRGDMAGIAQMVVLRNGSWLAFGRDDTTPPAHMPRSLSNDEGETWTYSQSSFYPLTYGHRHVFFRLHEGPLLLVSFTLNGHIVTASGRTCIGRGLYAAMSDDDGETFPVLKLLVDNWAPPTKYETLDGSKWTATNTTAEPEGYLSARQDAQGFIHVVSSRQYYRFTFSWLRAPAPDFACPPS